MSRNLHFPEPTLYGMYTALMSLTLVKLPGNFAIAKVESLEQSLIEDLNSQSPQFWTISQSPEEISVVSSIEKHPSYTFVEAPWNAFRVVGQLDFSLTGILSQISTLLADAKISVFAVSTFDTDYLLVRQEAEDRAIAAWLSGGIKVELD